MLRHQADMPLLAGFGVNYLSLAVCSICCLSTALFMQRTRQLTVENRELQARLALMVIQNGRAGKGLEPDFSVDNSTQDLLVAQVVQCLQQAAHTTAEGQQHYCKSDIDGNQEEEILEPYSLDLAARALAGVMLMALLVGTWLTFRHLDALPNWMKRIGFSLLGGLPRGSEAVQQKMGSIPLSKLLAYRLDRWFSSNPYSKTLALLYITLGMVLFGGLGIFAISTVSLDDALWEAVVGVGIDWTFASDSAPEDEDTGVRVVFVRLMGLMVSIGGMLVTALMLGIVSDAISDKVDQMKKGKSEVLETNHTLILGWSDKLYGLVKELANANESIGGSAIVILSEREKEDMEEDIKGQEIDLRGSRVICRSGNPLIAIDLNKVSVKTARSTIILAQQNRNDISADVADAFTLRIVMSLMSIHQSTPGGLVGHIVAEVCDLDNEPLLQMVASDHRLETVVAHDVIGRLMIQSRRQPGLAAVWEDLLGFEDNEFYAKSWPELEGHTFGEVLLSFPDAVPVGILKDNGNVVLNPHDDWRLGTDEQVLVLAEDDDTYSPAPRPVLQHSPGMPKYEEFPIKERVLFVGWRRDMDDMIEVLDEFVVEGSELWLYSNVPLEHRQEMLQKGGLDPDSLTNLKLIYDVPETLGEVTDRMSLKKVQPERFSTVLILADESTRDSQMTDSDSRALATLLLVREMQTDHGCLIETSSPIALPAKMPWYLRLKQSKCVKGCIIISEILDSRTRHLINELNISEYVMSNEIISMALAMVSENASVNQVLRELFTEVGNELYVHNAARYLKENETVSFFELVARARESHEIVIGYKARGMLRPLLNPPDKSTRNLNLEKVELVVVLAEDDELLKKALMSSGAPLTPRSVRAHSTTLRGRRNRRQQRGVSRQSSMGSMLGQSEWMSPPRINRDASLETANGAVSSPPAARTSNAADIGSPEQAYSPPRPVLSLDLHS